MKWTNATALRDFHRREEQGYPTESLEAVWETIPSGSGFDLPTTVVSWENELRMGAVYHCMNDVGHYCGWAAFSVTIKPGWYGLEVDVKTEYFPEEAPDAEGLEDYVAEVFQEWAETPFTPSLPERN